MEINKLIKHKSLMDAVEASNLELNQEQMGLITDFHRKIEKREPGTIFYLMEIERENVDATDEVIHAIIDKYSYNMLKGVDFIDYKKASPLVIIHKTTVYDGRTYFKVDS